MGFVQCKSFFYREALQPRGDCKAERRFARTDSNARQQHTRTHARKHQRSCNLPPAWHVLVLHLAAWRDAERWARNGAGRWVDDGDGVASALSHRLVQLHVVDMLAVACRRRVERIRCGGEEE